MTKNLLFWNDRKVLVVGTGLSGIGAASLLYKVGADPILYDENENIVIENINSNIVKSGNIQILTGQLPQEVIEQVELLVLSPGVPLDTEFVRCFKEKGIPIWGEMELAYEFSKGKLIAITGTNGKTTTTALVGAMMKDYYGASYIVGNIGIPYTGIALDTSELSVTVAEVSSFQLETVEHFKPMVSCILNITPDHLNRHHTMEEYAKAKEEIAKNQTKSEVCVLNYDNEYTKDFGTRCQATVIYFSSSHILENGFYLEGETIYESVHGSATAIMSIHDMNLVGMCNVENVMAALAIGSSMNIPMDYLKKTIQQFKAVEHRIEYVATKKGVTYYNDSKGTNPDAAIQGLKAMNRPTFLIGGGYDKQSQYDDWVEYFPGKVKLLILIGQTKEKIAQCAKAHGFDKIVMADGLEEAMQICERNAKSGDAVLLSPACASWGMFPNYEVRGEVFKQLVHEIKE